MKLIGLTGGVGMGKSTTARFLAERGLPVVDTDQIARDVVEPGQPGLTAIVVAFGKEMLLEDGRLNRPMMAARVFSDPAMREQLESIVHPAIRKRWLGTVQQWRQEERAMGVVMIPLLLETGAESMFDRILCSACSRATQEARLVQRGWNFGHVRQRIEAQAPISRKMAAAHYVVWTEASLDVHAAQVDRILRSEGWAPVV